MRMYSTQRHKGTEDTEKTHCLYQKSIPTACKSAHICVFRSTKRISLQDILYTSHLQLVNDLCTLYIFVSQLANDLRTLYIVVLQLVNDLCTMYIVVSQLVNDLRTMYTVNLKLFSSLCTLYLCASVMRIFQHRGTKIRRTQRKCNLVNHHWGEFLRQHEKITKKFGDLFGYFQNLMYLCTFILGIEE
jgi:hypothetical protein